MKVDSNFGFRYWPKKTTVADYCTLPIGVGNISKWLFFGISFSSEMVNTLNKVNCFYALNNSATLVDNTTSTAMLNWEILKFSGNWIIKYVQQNYYIKMFRFWNSYKNAGEILNNRYR